MNVMSLTTAEALRLAAASQLLLVVGLLLRDHRRSRITAASSLLVACVVCYLIMPFLLQPGVPVVLRQIAGAGAFAVPFAFWLAARLYFEDDFQPTAVHGLLLVAWLGARAAVVSWPLAVSAIGAAAVLDALRRIHSGSSSDLLLSRLRLRYATLLGTGVYALLVLTAEATVERGSRADGVLSAANDVGLFLLVGTVSMMILRVEPELVRAGAKRPAPAEPPSILEKRLEQLIEAEQIFKTEGLTIGALADKLGEQEYKVRQLINARLGFRNFGAFLNHYRVREARKLLSDPGQKQLGVAEIAYRYGYSSLGPFNRAFKEIVGQTPTEYRKAMEQDIVTDSEIGKASTKPR
jgi:AraC-like DNA-binding protein